MSKLKDTLRLTQKIVNHLKHVHNRKMDRGKIIEQIHLLIEQREKSIGQIQAPYNDMEQVIGKEIIKLNDVIAAEMANVFSEIQTEMTEVQLRKSQNYAYLRPYGKIHSTDGMYLDSKL